jgi:D-amino-acid dehydrogenase
MTEGDSDATADVIVVGTGIIGIAVASYLQDDGRSVLLIDRGEIAMGASFGNAGAFAFSDVLPLASPGIMRKAPKWLVDPLGPLSIPPAYLPTIVPWLLRFWRASRPDRARHSMLAQIALMRLATGETMALIDRAGLTAMLRPNGNLELYESEEELTAALPGWEARKAEGIEFEHLRGAAIAALQPGLSPRFKVATFVPGWKNIADPFDFARALATRVEQRGGRFERAEAVAVKPAGERIEVMLKDGTALRARQVVIACGAWSRSLARGLGDRIPLETERGYNTTLPPGAFDVRRQLTFGGHGFVVTPLSSGIRVGGAVELAGLARPPNFRRSEVMLRKAAAFLPGLKTEGGRQWMGFRPSLPDSLPVIGRSKASPDVVYAFGHGHLGLTQSAATGRLVADLLARRSPAIPIEAFRPNRF